MVFLVLPAFLLLTVVPCRDWAHSVPITDGNTASDLLRSRLAEVRVLHQSLRAQGQHRVREPGSRLIAGAEHLEGLSRRRLPATRKTDWRTTEAAVATDNAPSPSVNDEVSTRSSQPSSVKEGSRPSGRDPDAPLEAVRQVPGCARRSRLASTRTPRTRPA